jgi:hypothetical protein
MQEGREPFSEAVVAGSRLVEQKLLRLAREISPEPHDSEAECKLKMMFVVDTHL